MYTETRIALIVLAFVLAAAPALLAARIIAANRSVASTWTRSQGVVTSMAADDWVEIELGVEPNTARVRVPIDHKLGLSFLKSVPIFIDPADSTRMRMGGFLQMWLWPCVLGLLSLVLLVGGAAAAVLGGSPPPAVESSIRVQRPPSEWKAPLSWSLLGIAALLAGVLTRSETPAPRAAVGSLGLVFLLAMWALALENKTTVVTANDHGLRKTSAFGWRDIAWPDLGSVERERSVFGRYDSMLRRSSPNTSFPGREVTAIVFRDKAGRSLLRVSESMQPAEQMIRLFDTCAAKTGLRLELRTVYHPSL